MWVIHLIKQIDVFIFLKPEGSLEVLPSDSIDEGNFKGIDLVLEKMPRYKPRHFFYRGRLLLGDVYRFLKKKRSLPGVVFFDLKIYLFSFNCFYDITINRGGRNYFIELSIVFDVSRHRNLIKLFIDPPYKCKFFFKCMNFTYKNPHFFIFRHTW